MQTPLSFINAFTYLKKNLKRRKHPTDPQPELDDQQWDAHENIFYKKCTFLTTIAIYGCKTENNEKTPWRGKTNFNITCFRALNWNVFPTFGALNTQNSSNLCRAARHFVKRSVGAPAWEVAQRTNHCSVRCNWLFSALWGLLCHSWNILNKQNLGCCTRLREKAPQRKRWNYIPKNGSQP